MCIRDRLYITQHSVLTLDENKEDNFESSTSGVANRVKALDAGLKPADSCTVFVFAIAVSCVNIVVICFSIS